MKAAVSRTVDALEQVILGKPQELRLALACLLAQGHLLIEDVPGVGKTVLSHNKYYTATANISECGKPLQEWQATGGDPGSSVAGLPTDATVIGWAKALLGF